MVCYYDYFLACFSSQDSHVTPISTQCAHLVHPFHHAAKWEDFFYPPTWQHSTRTTSSFCPKTHTHTTIMAHSLRYCISHDHHENENKQTDTNPTSETNKRHYGWVSQGARAFALQIDTNALQIDTEHAESAQFMGARPMLTRAKRHLHMRLLGWKQHAQNKRAC